MIAYSIEIDLNYCYKLINDKKNITSTNQQQGDKGIEWLKLIIMSIWCDKKEDEKKLFYFPNLNKMKFCQEEVKKALNILSHQDPMYQLYVKEEENIKNELKEFNRLKEKEKIHKIELAEKDKQITEKNKLIANLENQIKILKNNIKSRKNIKGKENVKKYQK